MENLKIKDLLAYCLQEYRNGHGDYDVFVTDDEEGNGYHALWYSGQTACELSPDNRKYAEESNHDLIILKDKDKAIYLG